MGKHHMPSKENDKQMQGSKPESSRIITHTGRSQQGKPRHACVSPTAPVEHKPKQRKHDGNTQTVSWTEHITQCTQISYTNSMHET